MKNDREQTITIYDAKGNAKCQNSCTNSHPCALSIDYFFKLETHLSTQSSAIRVENVLILLCKRTAKKNTSSSITTEIIPIAVFARE